MGFDHLHLILNHVPVIGIIIAFALFLLSFSSGNGDLRRASLIVFAAIALLTIPTFVSGVGAEASIRSEPGVSATLVRRHEGAAMLGLWFVEAAGALALAALWRSRQPGRSQRRMNIAMLLLAVVAVGLMVRTGNTGGAIRHPEPGTLQGADVAEDPLGAVVSVFEPTPGGFTNLMVASNWWWAGMMVMHFVGLSLIIGVIGLLNLRIMGFAKELAFAPVHRLLPLAMIGLAINITTGMLAFIGMPTYYTADLAFWLKIGALMLLGVNTAVFYLTGVFNRMEKLKPGEDADIPAKLVAATSLVLWFAVIVCGRYIQRFEDSLRF